jgi:mRNA interferase MazF
VVIERGELWWYEFPASGVSHGPAKRRPVVVIQAQPFNNSELATVIVASLTGNLAAARFPGNVFVSHGVAGLPKDSVIRVNEITTVDRYLLIDRMGRLPADLIHELGAGLRLVLGL